jgi:integrase
VGAVQRIDRPRPWRARYRAPDGRERSRSFARKIDAERWLRDQEGRIDRGLWLDPAAGMVPFGEYAEAWLAGRSLAPKTVLGYRSLLRSRIGPAFGATPLARIAPDDVRAWVAGMAAEGLSPSRIAQARSLLGAICAQAVGDGLLGRNPAARVGTPRRRPRRQRFLAPEQVPALAGACEARQAGAGALVVFLAWSGLRWGEAVALRWGDIAGRRVRVRAAATEVAGRLVWGEPKTHEHRTVIVPGHALPPRGGAAGDDDLVFTAPRGGPLRGANFRRKVWLGAVEQCGLGGLVVHDLRDTAASLAIASGASVKAVQRMLGHASAAMTLDVYGGLYDDDLEALADRLEALAGSPRGTGAAQAGGLRALPGGHGA